MAQGNHNNFFMTTTIVVFMLIIITVGSLSFNLFSPNQANILSYILLMAYFFAVIGYILARLLKNKK